MIRFEQHGDFKRTLKLLEKISTGAFDRIVLHWANKGLTALRSGRTIFRLKAAPSILRLLIKKATFLSGCNA